MIDRHAVAALLESGRATKEVALQMGVSQRTIQRIREDPEAPPLELLRQLREEGVRLGESTFYRIYRSEREALPAPLMVRYNSLTSVARRPTRRLRSVGEPVMLEVALRKP